MTDDWSAARIAQVRFRPVRGRHGYDMGEVDAFLDRLAQAVEAGTPLGPLVAEARFSTTALREGYDMGEVDDFLDAVVRDPAAAPASASAPAESDPTPTTPVPTAPADPPVTQPLPTVGDPQPVAVQEQRGFLSRLFGRR